MGDLMRSHFTTLFPSFLSFFFNVIRKVRTDFHREEQPNKRTTVQRTTSKSWFEIWFLLLQTTKTQESKKTPCWFERISKEIDTFVVFELMTFIYRKRVNGWWIDMRWDEWMVPTNRKEEERNDQRQEWWVVMMVMKCSLWMLLRTFF